jgi:hypothetical protein
MATSTEISSYEQYLIVDNLFVVNAFKFKQSPARDYILKSDDSGYATWEEDIGGGGSIWSLNGTNAYYNSGNVGIGISEPAEKLHVIGNARLTGDIIFSEINGLDIKNDAGDEIISIDTTGKVGIGTTTPSEKLHIEGNAIISGDLTVNGSTHTINTTNLLVEDPLIKVGNGNTGYAVDLGIYGMYVDGGVTGYSGVFFDVSDDRWKFFYDVQTEPTTTVNTSATGYTKGALTVGDLRMDTVSNAPTFSGAYTTFTNPIRADQAVVIESATEESITGTFTTTVGDSGVTGDASSFTRDIAIGDTISMGVTGEIGVVNAVISDTYLTIAGTWGSTSSGITATIQPAPFSVSYTGSTGTMMVVGTTGWVGIGTASPSYPLHVTKGYQDNWQAVYSNGSNYVRLAYEDTKGIDVELDDDSAERAAYTTTSTTNGQTSSWWSNGRFYSTYAGTNALAVTVGVTGAGTGVKAGQARLGPEPSGGANNHATFQNIGATGQGFYAKDTGQVRVQGRHNGGSDYGVWIGDSGVTGGFTTISGNARLQGHLIHAVVSSADALYTIDLDTLPSSMGGIFIFSHSTPTITLPSAAWISASWSTELIIIHEGSGSATVQRTGSDTIDGATETSFTLAQYERVRLISNGVDKWYTM